MSNKTAWTGGLLNSSSTAFQSAFNAADLNSLTNTYSVLSSVAAFDNTSQGDQFMDISFVGTIASSTIVQGAGMAFFLYILQEDASTYGDGRLTAGTQTNYAPLMNSLGGFPIIAGASVTKVAGSVIGLVIPPRKFALVVQNLSGFNLASSGNACQISTYKQNTNA
jgi:hypothetical protein